MKLKYETFLQLNTKFFLQKVLSLLSFGSCANCMRSGNFFTGEPCTFAYVTLFQSFHRGTLSIHWYIARNLQTAFFMSVLFRRSSKTAMFSRFLMVVIATSNFMSKVCNGGFASEFSVSMLKKSSH